MGMNNIPALSIHPHSFKSVSSTNTVLLDFFGFYTKSWIKLWIFMTGKPIIHQINPWKLLLIITSQKWIFSFSLSLPPQATNPTETFQFHQNVPFVFETASFFPPAALLSIANKGMFLSYVREAYDSVQHSFFPHWLQYDWGSAS